MYLSHHYLIDLVGGACLSVLVFYLCMPEGFKDVDQIQWDAVEGDGYEMIGGPKTGTGPEIDLDEEIRKLEEQGEALFEHMIGEDEESRIDTRGEGNNGAVGGNESADSAGGSSKGKGKQAANKKPKMKEQRSVSWGETKVVGEGAQVVSEDSS